MNQAQTGSQIYMASITEPVGVVLVEGTKLSSEKEFVKELLWQQNS